MLPNQVSNSTIALSGIKAKHYFALLKFRLSILVVFSGGFGFLLASLGGTIDWVKCIAFCIGSFMITGSANIINQIIEKDLDKLMKRTHLRPLPTGAVSINEAMLFASLLATVGTLFVAMFVGVYAACLGLFSLVLYGFVYTPLKQKTPIAVFVGAFPGAFPPLIGYIASAGTINAEALIIFAIQFVWQFPHFWAIAWVGDTDYKNAGFRLLPNGEKGMQTSLQIFSYTMLLLPLGLMPWYFGFTGIVSAIIITICGFLFLLQSLHLVIKGSDNAALRLMFASFIYLPIVQIALLLDKI